MVEMETTGNTKVTKPSAEEVEFTGKNVDSALVFLNNSGDVTFTQEEERSLVCKVDWMLLPLLAAIYMLQFVDKNLINSANIMGLGVDTGTSSQQFTTLAWSYWVTYLLSQPLTGYVLQKLPVAKVLGWNVSLWGVVVALNCVCKNYASLLALRIVLPAQDAARSFQRNYKACDNCQLKKERCELGGDQQGVYGFTGPPCASCRRERRQCVFREARDTKKRHYSGRSIPITRALRQRGRSEKLQSSSQPDKHSRTIGTAVAMETNLVDLTASPPSLPFDPSLNLAVTATSPRLQTHQGSSQGIADKRDAAIEASLTVGDARILSDRSSKIVTDTTILKGNDAIDVLLEAAAGQGSSAPASLVSPQPHSPRGGKAMAHSVFHQEERDAEVDATSSSPKSSCLKLIRLGSVEANILSAWKSSVFVRTGLLSAEHAITLVDAFFNNLAPFTFVGTRSLFHQPDRNQLLLREPLLCTKILLISSRHHSVPAAVSLSRRFFIHDELWERAIQLIQRIMLGQGQGLRSIASIEALLLLAEWYPAPLNARSSWDEFEEDGRFLNKAADDCYIYKSTSTSTSTSTTHILKQQDQTRWMLLGAAHSLGHEISVFKQCAGLDIRDLLLAHMTILAARLGLHTMIPFVYSQDFPGRITVDGDSALGAWTELLTITNSIHEQLLASETKAKEMLSSGQYTVLAAFFKSRLEEWFDKHLARNNNEGATISDSHHDILSIEYHGVKLWINGLSMQAIFPGT